MNKVNKVRRPNTAVHWSISDLHLIYLIRRRTAPFSDILGQTSRSSNVLRVWRNWRCRMKHLAFTHKSWFQRGMKNRAVSLRDSVERPAYHQGVIQSRRECRGTVWLKRLHWLSEWAAAYCSMVSVSVVHCTPAEQTCSLHDLWCTVAYILAPCLLH